LESEDAVARDGGRRRFILEDTGFEEVPKKSLLLLGQRLPWSPHWK